MKYGFLARWSALMMLVSASAANEAWPADVQPGVSYVRYDAAFGDTWYDGRAEVATYALTYPRYGEARPGGTAVAVFVSEHFDPSTMVKAERATDATIPMIKLNLVQDFQTGIYDYNTMTSAYAAIVDRAHLRRGNMSKVMYGSQDWCGQVYQQATMTTDGLFHAQHSYFEGEADVGETLPHPPHAFWEDGLLLWARGLAGPAVPGGGHAVVPLLRSLETARMKHIRVKWDRARMARDRQASTIEVPAGRFEVRRSQVTIDRAPSERTYSRGKVPDEASVRIWQFWVETKAPHRLIKWARDDGLSSSLVASRRLQYWDLQRTVHERHLPPLGLERLRSPRAPRSKGR